MLHLPRIPVDHCSVCLWPVPVAGICGRCISSPPVFTRTISAFRYTFPIDALIHSLKYQSNLAMVPVLAQLLLTQLQATGCKPDIIIPMPLHPIKLQERGFNQSMEIARYLSKYLRIVLLANDCKRIRHTLPQAELPWKKRQKNIRNAFSCKTNLSGKHIAVVDDVMTTGATLNEVAKVLHQQGAKEISNWVIARTFHEQDRTSFHMF